MRVIEAFDTYDEANEHQLTLLASGIDARVEYAPGGSAAVYTGGSGRYALLVEEEHFDEAYACISRVAESDFPSIARCPKCGSNRVTERELPVLLDVCLLMLPSMIRFVHARFSGLPFRCLECANTYRKKA